MAIRPNNEYPGATTTPDSSYPYGGAQNVSSPGDGTGTPWEQKLINDLFGFQQALLEAAGITPNDTPETAIASQYYDALLELFAFLGRELNRFDAGIGTTVGVGLADDKLAGLVLEATGYSLEWRGTGIAGADRPRFRHRVNDPGTGLDRVLWSSQKYDIGLIQHDTAVQGRGGRILLNVSPSGVINSEANDFEDIPQVGGGVSVSSPSTGVYEITHNLGTQSLCVNATALATSSINAVAALSSANTITVRTFNSDTGAAIGSGFCVEISPFERDPNWGLITD